MICGCDESRTFDSRVESPKPKRIKRITSRKSPSKRREEVTGISRRSVLDYENSIDRVVFTRPEIKYERKDAYGKSIVPGGKKHKVTFIDKIHKGTNFAEVIPISSEIKVHDEDRYYINTIGSPRKRRAEQKNNGNNNVVANCQACIIM